MTFLHHVWSFVPFSHSLLQKVIPSLSSGLAEAFSHISLWLFVPLLSPTRPCRIECGKSMSKLRRAMECLMKAPPRKEPGIPEDVMGRTLQSLCSLSHLQEDRNHATLTSSCSQHCKCSIKILHVKK